jgi:hypothetical protein
MSPITRPQRLYLGAVAVLALWVGVWCFFVPWRTDMAIPWQVQPLCAAFLGAMYLSGAVFCASAMCARRWLEVRVIMPIIAMWTGGLLLISFFYMPTFNFTHPPVWVWFIAYTLYPLIGLGFYGSHRAQPGEHPLDEPALPAGARHYLLLQAALMIGLGLALLAAPEAMRRVWPWQTGRLMLNLYSAPLLSYGIGSLLLRRQRAWAEVRLGLLAMAVFTGAGLLGMLRYSALLDGPRLAVALWLGWLAASTAVLGSLAWLGFRTGPRAQPARMAHLAEAGAP